jgi:hypothetical protein
VVDRAAGDHLLVVATGESGDWKWMTNARSGLSKPIPSADVAATTFS